MNAFLERCRTLAPNLTELDPNLVADLVEAIDRTAQPFTPSYPLQRDDTFRGTDSADNWIAILSASEATLTSCMSTLFELGERNELRADHLRIVDRRFESDPVSGTATPADPYVSAITSTIVRKRSKRGTYSEVRRYGQTLVTGNVTPSHELTPSTVGTEYMLEQCKRGNGYYDGIGVARVATAVYELPELIGGEQTSYSEVLPADVSAGLTDYSYSAWTTGAYDGVTRHSYRRVKYSTRVRLPHPRARKGESFEPRTVDGVTMLVAPAENSDSLFMGHRRMTRVASARGKRVPRTYSETFRLTESDPVGSLFVVATDLQRGTAVRWHVVNGARGTLTRGRNGRYSFTLDGSNEYRVRGVRTVATLVRNIAPAFM